MGNICFCRRRAPVFEFVDMDEDAWELVPNDAPHAEHVVVANQPTNGRLKRTVRRIVLLIRLRWFWSRVMSSLNAPNTARLSNHTKNRLRTLATYLKTYLIAHHGFVKPLFGHLHRVRGRLQYLNPAQDQRFTRARAWDLRQRLNQNRRP